MKNNYFFTFLLMLFTSIMYAQPSGEDGTEFANGDLISVPNSNNINTTSVSVRTIETYFKVDNGTNRQVIYEEGGAVNALLIYIENGYVHAGVFNSSGSNAIFFRKSIVNNTWYHVAMVLDGTDLSFYIDGTLQDSNSSAFSIPSHSGGIAFARSSSNMRYADCTTWTSFGSSETCVDDTTSSDGNPYYFAGHLWGFRVWNTARTASEIDTNKDTLITDTSTSPGDDLIMFLDDDTDTIEYLASDDTFQTADFVLEVNKSEVLDATTRVYLENDILKVEVLNSNKINNVKVYSINGKLIVDKQYDEEISLSSLSKGVYIVKLDFENQNTTVQRKILIY